MRNSTIQNANETQADNFISDHTENGQYFFGTNHFFKSNSKQYHNTNALSSNNGRYVYVFQAMDGKTRADIVDHLIAAEASPRIHHQEYDTVQGARIGAASLAKGSRLTKGNDIAIVPQEADDFGVRYRLITFKSAVYQGKVRWASEAEMSA